MSTTKKVTIKYDKIPNLVPYAVSGVWGGINSSGNIDAYLYIEKPPAIDTTTLDIVEDSITPHDEHEDHYTRLSVINFICNPRHAKSIGKWLISKAEEMEELLMENKGTE